MNTYPVDSLYSFIDSTGRESKSEVVLFRGQSSQFPLIPKIARKNPQKNTSVVERRMLNELRRTGGSSLPRYNEPDLDLLVRAQHFGMATRLLDWTSNPLVAIWFACRDRDRSSPSFVYFFDPQDESLPASDIADPFSAKRTAIFKPNLNNPRIIAQSGWFTLHAYTKSSGRFVPLEENRFLGDQIECYEIEGKLKDDFIDDLDHLGINDQSMFPDMSGLCGYLNWKHDM